MDKDKWESNAPTYIFLYDNNKDLEKFTFRENSYLQVFFVLYYGITPPSPLELNGRWNVEKKGSRKSYFFLNGPTLYPPSPLNGPAIKRKTFFCGFPKGRSEKGFFLSGPTTNKRTPTPYCGQTTIKTLYCGFLAEIDILFIERQK